jgi:hypothetical protein
MGMFPAYYLFNALLYSLQIMHVIWFYMILRVAFKSAITGKVDKDDRSESDNDSEYKAEQKSDCNGVKTKKDH